MSTETSEPAGGTAPSGHCSEVLKRVYEFIDHELDEREISYAEISAHLQECAPCLEEHDLDVVVKELLARSCRCETTPESVRSRVLAQIRTVQVHMNETS